MREHLERQADAIEWVLWSHGVRAQVAGGTVGPRLVRFYLHPAPGVRVSRLVNLTEELALVLASSTCRVTRQAGQVVLELPRPDAPPVRLQTLIHYLGTVPRETALLGLDEENRVLGLRLSSPDVAHVLVAGTTGSGKTALLQILVLSLAQHNPAAALQVLLIDPQGRGLGALAALPHARARGVATEPAESATILTDLVAELEDRARRRVSYPRVVVVIDELADVVRTPSNSQKGAGVGVAAGVHAERSLARLVGRGRGVGLHVVAATQKPTVAAVGSLVQANFPTRIVGRVASAADARVAAGRGGLGAESLLGRGDFLLVSGGTVVRFQGAYEDPVAVRSLVQEIAAMPEPDEPRLLAAVGTGTEGLGSRMLEAARRGWQIVK